MGGTCRFVALALATAVTVGTAVAQTQPSPGPTKPPTQSGSDQPGTSAAAGPTIDDCRAGWTPSLRWAKQEFEDSCAKMKEAK